MGAPPPGKILYTFTPGTWTGTYVVPWNEHYQYDELSWAHGSEITDAYNFRTWGESYLYISRWTATACRAFAYKQETMVGVVHRVRCKFSVTPLPYNPFGRTSVAMIGFADRAAIDSNPDNWSWDYVLYLRHDGKLSFSATSLTAVSTNGISAGTTYELELWTWRQVPGDNNYNQSRVYINGALWLYAFPSLLSTNTYVQFMAGMNSGTPSWYGEYSFDATLHMEDIVWTMENPGWCGWTMMAPGI